MQNSRYITLVTLTLFLALTSKTYSGEDTTKQWAQKTLKHLTLEEKIGQLFISATIIDQEGKEDFKRKIIHNIDKTSIAELVKKHHIGGVLFLRKLSTPKKQLLLTNTLKKLTKLPLFIAQDLEWGLAMRLYNTIKFPHNMTLGAIKNNSGLLYSLGKEIARQCKLIGVNINFAPVVDINSNPKNPVIHMRSFGDNPQLVAQKATALMQGLQDGGVIACAKHFPGHGDTSVDSHLDLPTISHSLELLQKRELHPFKELIKAGIISIMTGHLQVPALEKTPNTPATLSKNNITHLLKKTLHFKGLAITDALNMRGVLKHHTPGELELQALHAGNDILLCPTDTPKAIAHIKKAIQNGEFSLKELDNRVLKILYTKAWILHKSRANNTQDNNTLEQKLHTPYAYTLKQTLFDHAITVVQNKDNLIPLTKAPHTTVTYIEIGKHKVSSYDATHQHTVSQLCATLEKYITLQTHTLPTNPTQEQVEKLFLKLHNTHILLIGVYSISNNILHFIAKLSAQKKNKNIILALFDSPYNLQYFKNIPTIIQAYEDDPCAETAVANILLGKLTPTGVLPVCYNRKIAETQLTHLKKFGKRLSDEEAAQLI